MKRMKAALAVALACAIALGLCACGGGEKQRSADLEAVLAAFQLGEDMMELNAQDMCDLYYMDAADIRQAAGAVHTSGVDCDEILLVEATDSAAADRVKKILDARYQAKLNETENYLPEEHAIVEGCKVSREGNYVAMIVAPNAAELTEIYEGSFK